MEAQVTNVVITGEVVDNNLTATITNTPITVEFAQQTTTYIYGSQTSVSKTAGETLGGHRVVIVDSDDKAYYANNTTALHKNMVYGLTTGAANSGSTVAIQTSGELINVGWSWTPNAPLFLTTSGNMSHTPPTSGFVLIVGFAVTSTKVFIDIKQPIVL